MMNESDKKLHVGCGLCVGEHWVNVDGSWNAWLANHYQVARMLSPIVGDKWKEWPTGIVRMSLSGSLDFEENTFSAVYASHVLEHLPLDAAHRLLVECRRVLRPGGLLRVVVPDLEGMARKYLSDLAERESNPHAIEDTAGFTFFARLGVRDRSARSIFRPYDLYQMIFDYHTHYWMYDKYSLGALLRDVGFEEVDNKEVWESDIPDIDEVERRGAIGADGAGIALEARKGSPN